MTDEVTASPAIDAQCFVIGGHASFVGDIELGVSFDVRTADASGDQIREGVDFENVDERNMFPVAGQFALSNVRRGDLLAIEIEQIEPDPVGHCWMRPGIGFGSVGGYQVRQVDTSSPYLQLNGNKVAVPVRPHIGTLGVAPTSPRAARDLGAYGGNLDTPLLGVGSALFLRAQQDGGGLFVGDVHLGIGDGEVCGTGIEVAARVRLTARAVAGEAPPLPIVSTPDKTWVIGIGNTLEEALLSGLAYATERMQRIEGVTPSEAYLAVSQLLQIEVCQVVNPRRSVAVTMRSGMDAVLRPDAVPAKG
jgi:amidase